MIIVVAILALVIVFGLVPGLMAAHNYGLDKGIKRGRREVRPARSPAQPKATCLCEHGINFHKNGTGRCVQIERWEPVAFGFERPARCSCLQYVGPQPLPEYYHPLELTNGNV